MTENMENKIIDCLVQHNAVFFAHGLSTRFIAGKVGLSHKEALVLLRDMQKNGRIDSGWFWGSLRWSLKAAPSGVLIEVNYPSRPAISVAVAL